MSQLKTLIKQVDEAPSARDAMVLCQDRWIKNYKIQTGRSDGGQRFQSELLNLLDIAADKPAMMKAPKFEWFKAMMKISRTGLSLTSEGHLYVEAYEVNGSVKIKVTVGNHGKREMLRSMKEVKDVSAGHNVMKGDIFEYDELNRRVIKHTKTEKSSQNNSLDDVIGTYTRVEYHDGRIVDVYLMRSELLQAKKKSKNKRDDSTWNEWPLEMTKKVTYGRAKKELYRDPEGLELVDNDEDNDDETIDTPYTESTQAQIPSSDVITQDTVDEETGEVVVTVDEVPPPAPKSEKKGANPL